MTARSRSRDGVDLNRNFPNHFNYDEEGSSSALSSETYRGPVPVSEPETKALKGLLDRIGFSFQINYHSAGEWLLYADGWQIGTPTADDPIYYALSGNLDEPAIDDFHPGLSSDVLYVTNGETTDYAHANRRPLAWTPELGDGCPTRTVASYSQTTRQRCRRSSNAIFRLRCRSRSRRRIRTTRSHRSESRPSPSTSRATIPIRRESRARTSRSSTPTVTRSRSHVLAKRSIKKVQLKYRINGGRMRRDRKNQEWKGGERYAPDRRALPRDARRREGHRTRRLR